MVLNNDKTVALESWLGDAGASVVVGGGLDGSSGMSAGGLVSGSEGVLVDRGGWVLGMIGAVITIVVIGL